MGNKGIVILKNSLLLGKKLDDTDITIMNRNIHELSKDPDISRFTGSKVSWTKEDIIQPECPNLIARMNEGKKEEKLNLIKNPES